ncbi:nucleoside phosphorylase [Paenibacillus filicis]|uniref:Uridine phosphorylase n=1 Tax=Paenibacillus filicis TaxID=669464 RepID=A0ABU9DHD9_9BACL
MAEKQAHIQLDSSIQVQKAILVGDPARVDKVGAMMDHVQPLAYNREFKSIKGSYRGEELLVISTGIGAPSAAIAMEELHHIGITTVIRVGSCGSMQKNIPLGALIIATGTVRDDGLGSKYVPSIYPAIPDPDLLQRAKKHYPEGYFGITRAHDGFYMDNNEAVEQEWSQYGVLGGDMETSIIFVLGTLRKMKTLSILNNVVLYRADLSAGVNHLVSGENTVSKGERASIQLALTILSEQEA